MAFESLKSQIDFKAAEGRVLDMNVRGPVGRDWVSITRWDAAAKNVTQTIGHRRHLPHLEMLLSTMGPSRFLDRSDQEQRFVIGWLGEMPGEVPDVLYLKVPQEIGNRRPKRLG
ncbi:MAG: hypothetical protein M3O09_11755 [Acidobacteriota bacterium]|nr:hypothetical protein [Acidobacteriota bacterium]